MNPKLADSATIVDLGIRWRIAFLAAEKAEAADPETATWNPVGVTQDALLAAIDTRLQDPQLVIQAATPRQGDVAGGPEIYRLSLLYGQAHRQLSSPTQTEREFSDRLLAVETTWQALAEALDTRPEVQGRSL
jgi:hypothetical protein